MPPNPKRTIPSRDDAVPAISRVLDEREGGGGRRRDRDACGEEEERHDHHPQWHRDESRDEQTDGADSRDQDAGGEGAGDAPLLSGTPGEVSECHEPCGVQSERQCVAERGEAVDVLQHERRPGQVREQRRVQEPLIQNRTDEHPIRQQNAVVLHRLSEPAWCAVGGRKGLTEHQHGHDEDAGTDQGEEDEQSAPIGERVEQPAEERADDGREPADDRQAPVEADQRLRLCRCHARQLAR